GSCGQEAAVLCRGGRAVGVRVRSPCAAPTSEPAKEHRPGGPRRLSDVWLCAGAEDDFPWYSQAAACSLPDPETAIARKRPLPDHRRALLALTLRAKGDDERGGRHPGALGRAAGGGSVADDRRCAAGGASERRGRQ